MLTNPRHEAKVSQGVTTEALGQDGLSYAPTSPRNLEDLLLYLAAVNGMPPPDVRWGSVSEFLALFDNRAACNVVYFVPHAAIRVEAMGWEDRLPTSDETKHMQRLVEEGMRDGAFGFSTGLTYVPGAYSDTGEVVEICKALRSSGGLYVTHCRYFLGDGLLDPFKEAITIGELAEVPVQISHYHSPLDGMGKKMVDLIDEGRDRGVDVTFDQYPYPAASTLLLSMIPYWVHAGGPGMLLARIATEEVRERLKSAFEPQWGGDMADYVFSHIGSDRNKEWEGRSLEDMARAWDKSVVDTVCDLLIEENLEVAFVARTGNPDNIRTILGHHCSDGRQRRAAHWRKAQPSQLRHLSLRSGPAGAGRERGPAGGCGKQDDLDTGPAARPEGQGHFTGRDEGRRGGLQPGYRSGYGHFRRPQTAADGHRLRAGQRPAGNRQR